jgi:hypothetical protein
MIVTHAKQPAMIEEHLVQRAAGGDRAAFGELYSRYARVVHAILLKAGLAVYPKVSVPKRPPPRPPTAPRCVYIME